MTNDRTIWIEDSCCSLRVHTEKDYWEDDKDYELRLWFDSREKAACLYIKNKRTGRDLYEISIQNETLELLFHLAGLESKPAW
jgi:hypothetical protein